MDLLTQISATDNFLGKAQRARDSRSEFKTVPKKSLPRVALASFVTSVRVRHRSPCKSIGSDRSISPRQVVLSTIQSQQDWSKSVECGANSEKLGSQESRTPLEVSVAVRTGVYTGLGHLSCTLQIDASLAADLREITGEISERVSAFRSDCPLRIEEAWLK